MSEKQNNQNGSSHAAVLVIMEMTDNMARFNRILKNEEYKAVLREIEIIEKGRKFCPHTIEHFLDTARIMYIISLEKDLKISKDIIYAAALLHDVGRVSEYKEGKAHEIVSADFAMKILPECGFTNDEIFDIVNAILCHGNGKSRENALGNLLYRADKLSRNCFCCNAANECYWDDSIKNKEIIY